MATALTDAEVQEIVAYCEKHPQWRIVKNGDGWSVSKCEEAYEMWHPASFLRLVRGEVKPLT